MKWIFTVNRWKLISPEAHVSWRVMQWGNEPYRRKLKLIYSDCSSMVVFLNMLFLSITMRTTYITIKYWKVSFCLLLTFLGRQLEERK